MNWLRKLFRIPEPAIADDPSVAVTKARAKLEAAERRGDTRTQGHALMELRAAKHAQLAQEIWG